MQITLSELREAIAHYLGWGDSSRRTDGQTARINDCLRRGIRQYLYPVHPQTQEVYVWSFLRGALLAITTESGVSTYDLPDGFGGFESPLMLQYGDRVKTRPISDIALLKAREPDITGSPVFAAVNPVYTAAEGQKWQLEIWPEPADEYVLTAQYVITPSIPTGDDEYLPGGIGHADGYIESCLAMAEAHDNDSTGIHAARFAETLLNDIMRDARMSAPDTLGMLPSGNAMPVEPARACVISEVDAS